MSEQEYRSPHGGRPGDSGVAISGHHPPYAILGPCPCIGCGRLVYWARGITRLNGVQVKGTAWWRDPSGGRHACVPKPISKHGLYTRERRARHRMIAQSRAEFDSRAEGSRADG